MINTEHVENVSPPLASRDRCQGPAILAPIRRGIKESAESYRSVTADIRIDSFIRFVSSQLL